MYDGVFTLFGAIVGFAPAIVRIVGALLIGIVKVSRLDTPLSYTSLDSPHRFFLGVLEEMRMRVEYRVRQRWFVEQRKKNSLRKKNKNSWGGLETGSVKVSANNIAASKINAEISFEMTKHKEMSGIGTHKEMSGIGTASEI